MKDRHWGQFCDQKGNTLLGSDSLIWFDLRWTRENRDRHASYKRSRYRKHLRHLYNSMTHYVFNGEIREVK